MLIFASACDRTGCSDRVPIFIEELAPLTDIQIGQATAWAALRSSALSWDLSQASRAVPEVTDLSCQLRMRPLESLWGIGIGSGCSTFASCFDSFVQSRVQQVVQDDPAFNAGHNWR